ncbi:hypothetical protein Vretimale_16818 [Volvox reticuliferus]|uniref:FHA domain-containing protein n=1 Tax=Volvox reticuliferus TaxID=1737510 RepID=A0A8J4FUH0_9CHLO|nr:hypothetical protein Vretifemale_18517 [Volvox reticuliferus]GIM13752.1 hypothetical protein Vretimale_16818 [Volvox reticuliferus]
METAPPSDDIRASKKPRIGEPVDPNKKDVLMTSMPELGRIKQSDNQLSYLQAQLAATESLYAAYKAEFQALAKQLIDIKRSQLKEGVEILKVAVASGDAAVRLPPRWEQKLQPSVDGLWNDNLESFSDIEEDVLFIEPDSPMDEDQPRDPVSAQQRLDLVSQAADGSTLPPAAIADGDGSSGPPTADHRRAIGSVDDTTAVALVAAPGSRSPAAGNDGNIGDKDVRMAEGEGGASLISASPASAPAAAATAGAAAAVAEARTSPDASPRDRLEALEATCSAVAQEDMEAQGALACLAGRAAKYYLRSTAVTLGRTTESKGDVDVDLTLEEPPPAAAAGTAAVATTAVPQAATEGATAATGAGAAPAGAGPQAAATATAAAAAATVVATPTAADGGGDQGPVQVPSATTASGSGAVGSGAAGPGQTVARGHLVSRRQAMIRLGADGQFRLINMGRQAVRVNDILVPQNHTINVPHLSLIEIASVRLLFMANLAAVARVMRRSAALSL